MYAALWRALPGLVGKTHHRSHRPRGHILIAHGSSLPEDWLMMPWIEVGVQSMAYVSAQYC